MTPTEKLLKALKEIEECNLPEVWADDLKRYVPYAVEYGSNGVREFLRKIARDAINEYLQSL